jgi:hypothetical protein
MLDEVCQDLRLEWPAQAGTGLAAAATKNTTPKRRFGSAASKLFQKRIETRLRDRFIDFRFSSARGNPS